MSLLLSMFARYIVGGVVHNRDRGSPFVAIKCTERLAEAGIEPSVGLLGDSDDNMLAETINGLYKAELIHPRASCLIHVGPRLYRLNAYRIEFLNGNFDHSWWDTEDRILDFAGIPRKKLWQIKSKLLRVF